MEALIKPHLYHLKLKLLHLPGAGLDGIDFSQISKATKVCNVYGHEIPIAEYCVGTILSWEMQLIKKINGFKKLDWKDSLVFSNDSISWRVI